MSSCRRRCTGAFVVRRLERGWGRQERLCSANTSPGLAAPPPVDTATGKVVEPEPEKTFLQKYGLMLGGIAFVLMLNAAAPPEEGQGGTGQAPARR